MKRIGFLRELCTVKDDSFLTFYYSSRWAGWSVCFYLGTCSLQTWDKKGGCGDLSKN